MAEQIKFSGILQGIGKVFDFAVKNEQNIDKVLKYLVQFGYLKPDADTTIEEILHAITTLHATAGAVNPNGTISAQTLHIMTLPRCGCKDVMHDTLGATALNKWAINNLTYYLDGWDDMTQQQWAATVRAAFDEGEKVCNVKFTQINDPNSANFIFGLGQGPQDQFDGPSGVLAWNELPPTSNYTGQLQGKADKDETWIGIGGTGKGILFKNVFCHEVVGHGMGLPHTNVPNSLMNPFYNTAIDKPQADDIKQLQLRYGPAVSQPVPSNPQTPSVPTSKEIIIRIKNNTLSIDNYNIVPK